MNDKLIKRFSDLQMEIVDYSDLREMTSEQFAETYQTPSDMIKELKYWLSLYYEPETLHYEALHDDSPRQRQQCRNEIAKIKRLIKTLEK